MSSLTAFLEELNDSILQPGTVETDPASIAYSMAIEFGARLTSAEVFDNFIPGPVAGEGKSRRRFRIDGYQIDENKDISMDVMPNLKRLYRASRKFYKNKTIAKVINTVFPSIMVKNSIAGILMAYTIMLRKHSYNKIIMSKK